MAADLECNFHVKKIFEINSRAQIFSASKKGLLQLKLEHEINKFKSSVRVGLAWQQAKKKKKNRWNYVRNGKRTSFESEFHFFFAWIYLFRKA